MQIRQPWTCWLQLLLIVPGFALNGCTNTAVSPGADRLHVILFCLSTDGQSIPCDLQERLRYLNAFVKEAIYRPGSTFEVFGVGPDRSHSRSVFTACIDHWKAPVSQSKAAFLREVREGVAGSKTGITVPAGCRAPGQTTPGSTKLVVFPDVSPLPSDIWQTVSAADSQGSIHHSGAVCDRSPSTLGAASCTPAALLGVFDRWLTQSLFRPGSTFFVEVVGPLQATPTPGPIFQLTVPTDMPLGQRVAHVLGARLELSRLVFGPPEQYGSTIAEALNAAVLRLRERPGVKAIYLLSDMLQITPVAGGQNFERSMPPASEFLAWLKKNGLAPDLQGIGVLACGLHSGQFGPQSAAYTARLADTWQKTFQSLGATDIKLYTSCEAALAA